MPYHPKNTVKITIKPALKKRDVSAIELANLAALLEDQEDEGAIVSSECG